jgi:hypothetical protein
MMSSRNQPSLHHVMRGTHLIAVSAKAKVRLPRCARFFLS